MRSESSISSRQIEHVFHSITTAAASRAVVVESAAASRPVVVESVPGTTLKAVLLPVRVVVVLGLVVVVLVPALDVMVLVTASEIQRIEQQGLER